MTSTHAGPPATVLPPRTFRARRKAALTAVLAQVNASRLKPASLGVFSAAPDRNLWSSRHNPQIRATGGPRFGGAEFRSFFGLCNVGPKRRADIVDHVLHDARSSFVQRRRVASPNRYRWRVSSRIASPLVQSCDPARCTSLP